MREREREADWLRTGRSVLGPLLTLALAIAADLLARRGFPRPEPIAALLLAIAYAGLQGGLQPGLISAVITIVYGAHYFAEPGQPFHYTVDGALSFGALALAAPALAVLTGRRGDQAPIAGAPPQADLMAWRAFQHDVTTRLSATSTVVDTLQSVARSAVPLLADWCIIQLRDGEGALRPAGSAHHRATRDPVVRALAERQLLADWGEPDGPAPRRFDGGAEGLPPGHVLMLPLVAGDTRIGQLVLGREGAVTFSDDEIEEAAELALRIALAVAHAQLARTQEEAKAGYAALFAANPQPMWVFDVETLAFLDVNDAAVRAYGYTRDEFLGMTIMDLRPPGEPAGSLHLWERHALRRPGVALTQHRRQDGSIADVELASHELTLHGRRARLVLVTDVTERTRAVAALHASEHQLRHAQRMDMVGQLAGGVAHDFNNLLTAIQGYSELLLRDLDPEDVRRRDVEEIRRNAARGGLLTRQLLTFSERVTAAPRPLDLNALVGDLESLVQRLVGADIRVATVLAPHLGRVFADPAQIEQLLVTLVLAARTAMPQGGELVIETAERRIGPSAAGRALSPGQYIVLTVSDAGGAPMRQAGPDTSSSMSMVYGIVRQLGGNLRVLTEPERGTTVRVYLPRHEVEEPVRDGDATTLPVGMETVLIAEDEEGVREVLRKVLTRHGYRVIEARHGRDALLEADRHDGPIHLLIADMVMPEMGGAELAEVLLQRRPGLKVIFISGYTSDEIERRGLAQPGIELLTKPFASDDLTQRVREVLDGAAV
ncbi:MAG TPA: response regulator [Gemmatimonadales bacterium]|nr:response regulator [Gemmatimonadales bacterium]